MKKCTYLFILVIVAGSCVLYSKFNNMALNTETSQYIKNENVSKFDRDKAGVTAYKDTSSTNDRSVDGESIHTTGSDSENICSNKGTSNSVSNDKLANNGNINNENVINGSTKSKITNNKSKVTNNNGAGDSKGSVTEKHGLVELISLDNSFVIDIKYATTDNFAKKKIYTMPMCLIQKNTAQKLIKANNEFKTLGYRIKVFDAYRPQSVQQVLWDAAVDKSFLANPKKGSIHSRGAAVDVTLVDVKGMELNMPSGYDEFSERAHLDYCKCDKKLIENRELLGKIMIKYGLKRISNEWWHFEDTNAKSYPLLNIAFEEFI